MSATVARPRSSSNGAAPDGQEPHDALPVDTLREAIPFLRRPFTANAVKWKIQTSNAERGWAMCVGHIDARLTSERLNKVCPDLWDAAYRHESGHLWCDLTIDGRTRSDIGDTYAGKGLVSDALKRAAVHFGVGVSLYAIPKMFLRLSDGDIEVYGGRVSKITDKGEARLREMYGTWLDGVGVARFGQPLDHGDVEDSLGDPDLVAPPRPAQQEAPQQPDQLQDPEQALAALLVEDHPLAAQRGEANAGMQALGASADRRLRELRAADDEHAMNALLDRLAAAQERGGDS